jgi:hypothetical protein
VFSLRGNLNLLATPARPELEERGEAERFPALSALPASGGQSSSRMQRMAGSTGCAAASFRQVNDRNGPKAKVTQLCAPVRSRALFRSFVLSAMNAFCQHFVSPVRCPLSVQMEPWPRAQEKVEK